MATPVPLYDTLSAHYDRFVNWEARLAHELPFLTDVLAQAHAVRVLDVACGTGQHALALTDRGYQVVGTDLSAPMIERARHAAPASAHVWFEVAGFGEQAKVAGTGHDAVLCLGNSLPHVLNAEDLRATLADFAATLRPSGGVLVLQNRNFERVMTAHERFMSPQGDDRQVFVRFYDFNTPQPGLLTFNMLVLSRQDGGWHQEVESTVLRPVLRDELAGLLAATGFSDVAFYGGLDGSPFDPAASDDLVAVACRRPT
jgi:SAM-dependent methyltransferase